MEPILREADLPTDLADALDDASWDDAIRADGEEALALTGKDVGTPIIHFEPPDGVAFFGPVISRLPEPGPGRRAVGPRGRAWRASPASPSSSAACASGRSWSAFGVDPDSVGKQEDWHGGSRRQRSERG